jgi:uncharacterized membrane protein YdjX (TVP38/TMEM64 family)
MISAIYLVISNYFTGRYEFINLKLHLDFTIFLIVFGGIIIQIFIPGYPQELLFIYSGMEYGFVMGGLINWIAMIFAAQLGYEIGRFSVEKGKKMSTISTFNDESSKFHIMHEKGNFGLIMLRLIPFAPNDGLSFLGGIVGLKRRNYFIVSIMAFLPYSFLYSYAGSQNADIINKSIIFTINVIILSLIIMAFLIYRLKNNFRR